MIRSLMKYVSFAVLVIIGLAVWKANDASLGTLVDTIWDLLVQGADIVVGLWEKFQAIGSEA